MENKQEKKKCSKCENAKKSVLPYVIVSVIFFGFGVYGIIDVIMKIIGLFSH
jgi:hypothetical protein